MTDQILTLPEAKDLLAEYMPGWTSALQRAIYEWNTGLAQYQSILDESARAQNLNQLWYHFSNIALADYPDVDLRKVRNQRFFSIADEVLLRFKFVDTRYQSKNYPTSHSRQWNLQIPLSGIPNVPRLEFGYRLDLTGTSVRDAMVLLKIGKAKTKTASNVIWIWQVWGPQISQFPTPGNASSDMFGRVVYEYTDYSVV